MIDMHVARAHVIISRNLNLSRPPGQRQPRMGPGEPFRQPGRRELQQPDPAQSRLFLSFPDGRSVSRFVSLHVAARAGKNVQSGMLDQPQPPLIRKPAEYERSGSRMLDHDTIPDISLTRQRAARHIAADKCATAQGRRRLQHAGTLSRAGMRTGPAYPRPGGRRRPRRSSTSGSGGRPKGGAGAWTSGPTCLSPLLSEQRHAGPAIAGRDITENVAGKAGLPFAAQGQIRGQLAHSVSMPGSPAVTP